MTPMLIFSNVSSVCCHCIRYTGLDFDDHDEDTETPDTIIKFVCTALCSILHPAIKRLGESSLKARS